MKTNETAFVAVIAILWVAITVLGSTGYWFAGLLLSIVLIALQTVLGAGHAGRVSRRLVGFLILPWMVLWASAFLLAKIDSSGGSFPSYTILGMHPSFAWIVLFYWLVPSIVVCVAFLALSDEWLSETRWEEFKSRIAELKRASGAD